MDYIHSVLINYLKHGTSFGGMDFQRRDRNLSSFMENIFICVSKMNRSLMVLEQHESE